MESINTYLLLKKLTISSPILFQNINKKKHLWRSFKKSGSFEIRKQYLIIHRKCKQAINTNKMNKIKSLCKKRNIKNFYNFVNSSLGRHKPAVNIKSTTNDNILSDADAAQEFGKYFYSTYCLDNNTRPEFPIQTDKTIDHIAFDINQIKICLKNLPCKYSYGPDKISTVLLNKLYDVLATPFALIFQKSLDTGHLPNIWRQTNIIPVFKGKRNKHDICNYRPISLTSTVCKVMETIIYNNIIEHCDNLKLIDDAQHGFRKKHSTVSNLIEMINDVTHNIDNKLNVDLITIDFSRAFDSISQSKLIQKLEAYGISGKILLWIKSFLTNRTFNVLVNGISSINFPVASSVQQGSKLGPLCYIIYANDLIKKFKFAQVKMYTLMIYLCMLL